MLGTKYTFMDQRDLVPAFKELTNKQGDRY